MGRALAHAGLGGPPTGPGEDTGRAPLPRRFATPGGALRLRRFAAAGPGSGTRRGMSFYDVFRGFFGFPGRCR